MIDPGNLFSEGGADGQLRKIRRKQEDREKISGAKVRNEWMKMGWKLGGCGRKGRDMRGTCMVFCGGRSKFATLTNRFF